MRGERRVAAPIAALLAVGLVSCTPALPETVVPDTQITVGWTGGFTSVNAAASPTRGNVDIAETIRADFGDLVDGEFVADEGFGTVTIVSDDPFTVRYDLAEPVWSDDIPLDAADLLLAWAGTAGYFVASEDAAADADAVEMEVPALDEFARAIDVTYPQPTIDWQRAVSAPVPAHVVGQRALGIDDPMEAKQAVIRAIQEGDDDALAEIATVWNEDFELGKDGKLADELLLSSGPFRIDEVSEDEDGQSVALVPNPSYRGLVTPKVARIELVPNGDAPESEAGERLDVVQLAPTTANREIIRQLERQDFTVDTRHDGTLWALMLDPTGVFTGAQARAAFLRTVPATALTERGSGVWATAYTGTTSMLSAPGSRAYDIVNEDSGFSAALATPADDAALERESAGIAPGASVCVLYDAGSEFAVGAFAALSEAVAEAGWSIADCGSADFAGSLAAGAWDAVIARVPIPETPEQILDQWGSQGAASISGSVDPERDALVAEYAQTTDVYEARDLLAQIEATIVRAAVALPIAVNPRATIIDRAVTGIAPRTGAAAPLTYGVTQWEVVP
ncbi:ABC transporter substrate-binding protein [Microbacterium sp. SA39]|uniref:ABC transporter substrate-binding protein n=1 Tax=Microbacterium sp. SA39 TaxID=1263625 RepID=UPI0005F9C695|nr:ABC transporter substrate-binding protein [Microbacterium sp. SA39]KJQ53313.1 Bacterial extracellular solute-binding protein, family 5 Middle [Microbacterium sp. SA39]